MSNLLIIYFESLESWIINSDINDQPITPNLNKLVSSSHTLFADKMTKQIRGGNSSDAQLIVNTGLLPIYRGATCHRYFTNSYFSLSKAIDSKYKKWTYIIDDAKCWNQQAITKAYGYDSLFANNKTDYLMCKKIESHIETPFLFQVVTLASHAPFKAFADSSSLVLPKNMPAEMANYIKSVNYTDNAIGLLLDKINQIETNTIIAIVGDHTIFHNEKRNEFKQYCNKHNLDIPVEKEFVPFIVHFPGIEERITVADIVYQMDIYPTLLHLLNRENYIWQGFGINLLDPNAERKITPEDALKLSDAIIRNNYFKQIDD